MQHNDRKEEFSCAYVRAVAAAAGFAADRPPGLDRDSVDLNVRSIGPGGLPGSPQIDIQVKSSSDIAAGDHIPFDLPRKNFDDIRLEEVMVPGFLIVIVLRPMDEWVDVTELEALTKFGAIGYWMSLRGQSARPNTATIRLHVPRRQIFDVTGLDALMRMNTRG